MKIYKAEKNLKELILANASISCLTHTLPATDKEKEQIKAATASKYALSEIDDEDLFYHKAILVSTNWNKNDDVFVPEEVWAAKHTPVNKPTNLNHNSSQIVGHITSNWAVDNNQTILSNDLTVDELPDKFHILVGAVIYKTYHNDEEYQEQAETLIAEIMNGEQYVSMECRLKDFDYAVTASDNTLKILPRNEETAFLTSFLRAYGGDGTYQNYKIGRVLKNISFIGKAYTKKPANPESVIFTEASLDECNYQKIEKNQDLQISGVSLISYSNEHGDNAMSEEYKKENSELKAELTKAQEEIKKLVKEMSQADVEKLRSELSEANDALANSKEAVKTVEADLAKVTAEKEKLGAALLAAEELTKNLRGELEVLQAEKVTADRLAYMIAGEFEKEEASEKVATFADLTDDQFKSVADVLIAAKKSMKDPKKDKKDEEWQDTKAEDNIENTDLDSSVAEDSVEDVTDAPVDEMTTIASEFKSFFVKSTNGDK